jgi:hypothetical protein
MTTTITIYPRGEGPITLVIRYLPELDGAECEGWWYIDNNLVALSLRLYRDFSRLEKQTEQRSFFDHLRKASKTTLNNDRN